MKHIFLLLPFIFSLICCDYSLNNPFLNVYKPNISNTGVTDPTGDIRITNSTSTSSNPSLVWTGTEYGVSWQDSRDGNNEIYFSRINASGVKQGSDVRITSDSAVSIYPSLVWTDVMFGVLWKDNRNSNDEIYFARIDTSDVKQGSDLRITNNSQTSQNPSMVWTGTEYGVSWRDNRNGNDEIYFTRINAIGIEATDDIRITNNSGVSQIPSLVWTGTEYGVCWTDNRDGNTEIYFCRIDASGVKQGSDVRITNSSLTSDYPSLEWTGTEYGVCWTDYRDNNAEIYFCRIDASGVKQGSDVRITTDNGVSYSPSLVWTGTEYGVSWYENRDGNWEIYFCRIDASGVKQGSDIRITENDQDSCYPSLVWTGTEYGVSWQDSRDGNAEIYFARLNSSGGKL